MKASYILMTEKDAVKCEGIVGYDFWSISLEYCLPKAFGDAVLKNWSILTMDKRLLEILVCPVTKEKLIYDKVKNELVSKSAKLAYPIKEGIPIMLESEARRISDEELSSI